MYLFICIAKQRGIDLVNETLASLGSLSGPEFIVNSSSNDQLIGQDVVRLIW